MNDSNEEQVLSITYLLKHCNHNMQYYIVKSMFK